MIDPLTPVPGYVADLRVSLTYVAQSLRAALGERPTPEAVGEADAPAPASHELSARLDLNLMERALVDLALAYELDPAVSALIGQGPLTPAVAERWLGPEALDLLDGGAPLLRDGVLAYVDDAPWHRRAFRVSERVLRFVLGERGPDPSLGGLAPFHHGSAPAPDDATLAALRRLAVTTPPPRVVELSCADLATSRGLVEPLADALDLRPLRLLPEQLPAQEDVRARWWRLARRELRLLGGVLVVDLHAHDDPSVLRQLANADVPAIVLTHPSTRAPVGDVRIEVPSLAPGDVRAALASALPADTTPAALDRLAGEFLLGRAELDAVARQLRDAPDPTRPAVDRAWDLCRAQVRARMDGLAQHVTPDATWDDLVLPPAQSQALRELVAHVRQRFTVHHTWAMGRVGGRGLGVSALFAGPSGTGKTTAAEVLARELRMDLYRIDLSAVVSKYIGETEKNLRRVFDAAEAGGSVLLFDEADALFGKRSEVKDSHDRYANLEVSYLLQRMESFRGLAILTTNLKGALDTAFLRRLRFVVEFPFPDAAQRAALWARMFPPTVPTDGVDPARLARLQLTGGVIRNVALHAAFLAADAGEPVRMRHVVQAARRECAKHERPLTEAEARSLTDD